MAPRLCTDANISYRECNRMSSYGISNALIMLIVIFVIHALIDRHLRENFVQGADTYAGSKGSKVPWGQTHPGDLPKFDATHPPMTQFTNSFVLPKTEPQKDPMQEMIEFANSNESWSACNIELNEDIVTASRKQPSPCFRQEAVMTNRTLVNAYEDDAISNGAEIADGLRGFEDWTGYSTV